MPKSSRAQSSLPPEARNELVLLGERLSLARRRRKIPIRLMAKRMFVSPDTVMRMEKGDPGVSLGVFATALWVMGLHKHLLDVAKPERDALGQKSSIDSTPRRVAATDEEFGHGPDF